MDFTKRFSYTFLNFIALCFRDVSEILIMVPALLGLKGNLEMTLASRLSTAANMGHLDRWVTIKLTCKGTLRQMFIRVYRLEIESVMLVFSTQLCELVPL
jgi:cation transporter-like permease